MVVFKSDAFFRTFQKGYKAVNSLRHVHILFTEVNQSADITKSWTCRHKTI